MWLAGRRSRLVRSRRTGRWWRQPRIVRSRRTGRGWRQRRVVRSRLAVADQVSEAWASLRVHPVRSVVMSLGVVVGVAATIATVSLSDSARFEVSATFARLRPVEVDVTLSDSVLADDTEVRQPASTYFPAEARARVRHLTGVRGVGYFADVENSALRFASSRHGSGRLSVVPHVVGADEHLLGAAGARVSGSGLDRWHVARGARVALVGRELADQLGIGAGEPERWVFVGGVSHLVIGRIETPGRLPVLDVSVVVPASVQEALYPGGTSGLLVHVQRGAAPRVAEAVPYALDPVHPETYNVPEPGDPRSLRRAVQRDLSVLGLYLALVSAVVGMIGIGTSSFGAVYERLGELGLRRALGARQGHLRRQVLTETVLAGTFAGIMGTIAGVAVVVVAARLRGWMPVVAPPVVLMAPMLGLLSGIGAGILPAFKAGQIEPADALRR